MVCQKGITDVQPGGWFGGGGRHCLTIIVFELPAKLQISLNQVVLQQDFQGLGKAFRCMTVYLTYVFQGV